MISSLSLVWAVTNICYQFEYWTGILPVYEQARVSILFFHLLLSASKLITTTV